MAGRTSDREREKISAAARTCDLDPCDLDLGALAISARRSGLPGKVPSGPRLPSVSFDDIPLEGQLAAEPGGWRAISDAMWRAAGAGRYDGALLGANSLRRDGERLRIGCTPIRYRDYLATDRILEGGAAAPPIAIGVHAALTHDGKLLCLRLTDGTLGLPGGAVDRADAQPARHDAIAKAITREVREEVGIAIAPELLSTRAIMVGGSPTHLIILLSASLDATQVAEALEMSGAAIDEGIVATELISPVDLRSDDGGNSLALRLALETQSAE